VPEATLHENRPARRSFRSFPRIWGEEWGDKGFGYLPYALFETAWDEAWFMDIAYPRFRKPRAGYSKRSWGFRLASSGFGYHCIEFTDPQDLRIAWALAVQREGGWLEVEELFVRPTFRRQGYGKGLLRSLQGLAGELGATLKLWISYADTAASNIAAINKLVGPFGLSARASGVRWAPLVATPSTEGEITPQELTPAYSGPQSPFTS